MYVIRANEEHEALLEDRFREDEKLRNAGSTFAPPYGSGGGNIAVMEKLRKLSSRTYDSLKEVIDSVVSAGHMCVPLLENAVKRDLPVEIKRWPIYQTTPNFLLGEIVIIE